MDGPVDATPAEPKSESGSSEFSGAQIAQGLEAESSAASESELDRRWKEQAPLDLYLSFKFSQGDVRAQNDLIGLVANEYKRTGVVPSAAAIEEVKQRVAKYKIPGAHKTQEEVLQKFGFSAAWTAFEGALRVAPGIPPSQAELVKVAGQMIECDRTYQARPRPNRNGDVDPHESFYRKYIVQAVSTGSATWDGLLAQVRQTCESADAPLTLQLVVEELVEEWEAVHPGEQFYPEPAPKLAE